MLLTARESDAATLSSDDDWITSLPLANLQDMQPTNVARSDGATSWKVDAGSAKAWNALALARTNVPDGATIQIDTATTEGGLTTPAWSSTPVSCWAPSGRPDDP